VPHAIVTSIAISTMEKTMDKKTLALGMLALIGAVISTTDPASAGLRRCDYNAQDSAGKYANAHGTAFAGSLDTACKRAKRECERRLERAFKQGKAGRGARCYRI
jgi:hypothetical protein